MRKFELELETARGACGFAKLAVRDAKIERRQPARHPQTLFAKHHEIAGALKYDCAGGSRDGQRHADATADVFLEACRTAEALR